MSEQLEQSQKKQKQVGERLSTNKISIK